MVQESTPSGPNGDSLSRRRFLTRATAASAALGTGLSLGGARVFGQSGREFKVGLIGCGGRGTKASRNAIDAAKLVGNKVTIHAVGDLFPDRATKAQEKLEVDEKRVFVGFDAFRKVLETPCDYVILATPPHFRPEHLEAAVAAGKHVFCEKPVAVDPPGIRRFRRAGAAAKSKNLTIVAGTQRRHQREYLESYERISGGAIGDILAGRCYWNMGGLWSVPPKEGWTAMEWQIRNWLYFTWLSGDHIVEQHVHQLDAMNWFIGSHPIAARGVGGREVRKGKPEYGNIFDHFSTELIYANPNPANGLPDLRISSMARQIAGCWREVSEFLIGTEGCSDLRTYIRGKQPWSYEGETVGPYVQEHADLMASIQAEEEALNEAENVATSTLTAILARTACYTGTEITWDEIAKSDERLGPTEYAFGPAPEVVVARPGEPM